MALYTDDYGMLDTRYIVHACLINPCEEPAGEEYLIGLILHVGPEAFRCSMAYPTRQRRDAAFEELSVMVRATAPDDDED